MSRISNRMQELFEELVPACGKADSEAGEIVRAYNRIAYRWYNDGDRLGKGYGHETCNAAGRYLKVHGHNSGIEAIVNRLWGANCPDSGYRSMLDELERAVIDLLDNSPELRTNFTEDMWNYYLDADRDAWDAEVDEDAWDEWDEDEW